MSSVEKISILGYKSIKALNEFPLTNLNLLIGANGAGKSNFIGFFRLLHEMQQQSLAEYVALKGGPDALLHFGRKTTAQLEGRLWFANNGYHFKLKPTDDNRFVFVHEVSELVKKRYPGDPSADLGKGHAESQLPSAKDPYSPYIRKAMASWQVYHFHDTSDSALVKRIHPSNDNLKLRDDGANLAPFLMMLAKDYPAEYERIIDHIQLVAPYFGAFVHRYDEPNVQIEWQQKSHKIPQRAHMLSDGTLRFICLATLLMQPPELQPDTILIDEPELGLHPYAVTVLAAMLRQASELKQIIVASQSVQLVDEVTPEDVIVVEQNSNDGSSTFIRLTNAELSEWLKTYSLGQLWQKNLVGGRP